MSFAQSFSEARGILNAIQHEKTDGRDGESSSPIYKGTAEPGTSMSHPIPELTPRRTRVHTRNDGTARQYADTGSGDGPTKPNKSYCSSKLGRKNLAGH